MNNLITDVPGVLVGNAHDENIVSGVSVVIFETPAVASVDVRGGAPGTRETDLLSPERVVPAIDAIVLSGGSAFGLEAAAGVMAHLAESGRGFPVGAARVPIVSGAILFDLLNGGDKGWGRHPPYRGLGFEAACAAAGGRFPLGTVGAGFGATTADLKGGLGSASAASPSGHVVGAIVAVNALGSLLIGSTKHFWAATDELGAEFGGFGMPSPWPADAGRAKLKATGGNTTIAVVATDAVLTKAEAKHLAVMAQDGLGRAIRPIHTPLDGDTVFAAATGKKTLAGPRDLALIGATAASVLARACARGIYEAAGLGSWRERWG